MSVLVSRRQVIAGLGVFGLSVLAGCDSGSKPLYKYGKDMSDQILGRTFKLTDTDGYETSLSSYRGMMPMVVFGFTKSPLIIPAALVRAAEIKKMMGKDGERFQLVFVTLDPERDTPAILDAFVKSFDPSFVALYGTLKETAATAKEFNVVYEKISSGSTYTLSHSTTSFVYDYRGTLRLGLSQSLSAQECVEDLLNLMEICE